MFFLCREALWAFFSAVGEEVTEFKQNLICLQIDNFVYARLQWVSLHCNLATGVELLHQARPVGMKMATRGWLVCKTVHLASECRR